MVRQRDVPADNGAARRGDCMVLDEPFHRWMIT